MSRIGKKLIVIPEKVKIQVQGTKVLVEGPKGKLDYELPQGISIEIKGSNLIVKRASEMKFDRALHGLVRTLIVNMIKGVTDGYTKELEIQGVGYKAEVKGNDLVLILGFSHPVIFPMPEGIKIEVVKQTQISVKGLDKARVGQTAAEIRDILKPEPYKGKGIRYVGEYVRKKIGKTVTK